MAKGKGKKVSSGGPHKKHGPKRHMFKEYKPMIYAFAQSGLLKKYYNRESFELSLNSRGIRNIPNWLWTEMISLPTEKEKKEWFKNLKTRNITKEDKDREAKKAAKEAIKTAEAVNQSSPKVRS